MDVALEALEVHGHGRDAEPATAAAVPSGIIIARRTTYSTQFGKDKAEVWLIIENLQWILTFICFFLIQPLPFNPPTLYTPHYIMLSEHNSGHVPKNLAGYLFCSLMSKFNNYRLFWAATACHSIYSNKQQQQKTHTPFPFQRKPYHCSGKKKFQ